MANDQSRKRISESQQWDSQSASIKNLSLWDENPRFPSSYFDKTEKDLIEYFVSKKDFKLDKLAAEIVRDFDLPQLEKLVVYGSNGKNIVLEGNRRLAAYKLLNDPELTSNARLKRKLNELKSEIEINSDFNLECVITKDRNEGFRYTDRKHLRGNNEVPWGDSARAHHKTRQGDANPNEQFKVAIAKRVRSLDFSEKFIDQILGKGFITTFGRIIEHTPAWSVFGFSLDDNAELQTTDKDFDEKLKVIIFDVLQKAKFEGTLFSRLDTKQIESYLKQISKNDYGRVANEIEKQAPTDPVVKEPTPIAPAKDISKQKIVPKSSLRHYLIPDDCILEIHQTKINSIYYELKENLVLDVPKKDVSNAVGVLFRVFLEISLDHYAEVHGKRFKKNEKIKQKIAWVVSALVEKGYNEKEFKYIHKVGSATAEKSYLSIENFHEYVHSTTIQPTSSDLKGKWDNLQGFFEILFQDILNKK